MSFFIQDAFAAAAAPAQAGNDWTSIVWMVGFFIILYFVLLWPQSKRAKEHRNLIANLAKGDEIVTNGGIVGKITKISDDFLTVMVAENVEIRLQKSAITTVLPKGTVKTL